MYSIPPKHTQVSASNCNVTGVIDGLYFFSGRGTRMSRIRVCVVSVLPPFAMEAETSGRVAE